MNAATFEARVPAPLSAALVGGAMWLGARAAGLSISGDDAPVRTMLAVGLAQCSAALAGVALVTFWRAGTTIDPTHPDRACALVTHGVYRFSRNPMYLSLVLLLGAYALRLGAWPALLGPLVFAAYTTRFQIAPEERALRERFGADYDAYCQRTRRWL